ncbi:hypothetical protein MKZ38_006391 [Zalerion maritima]|uniref:Chromatin modification-related protein EAF3 n=1 Tax=Zalerion maritima TaxID=339359 RepID=A0AAD5RIZ7_9PEZI|nr:hypothetical protein MKZ38_006391 [Zalerion maritima]
MPPKQQQRAQPPFTKDEKVLCFHLDLLYEARVTDVTENEEAGEGWLYKVHYKGWKASWDDWVTQDRIRKFTQENQELAQTLLAQKRQATEKGPKSLLKKSRLKGVAGSDVGSGRGSEERGAGAITSSGRGPRRYRDYELEQMKTAVKFGWTVKQYGPWVAILGSTWRLTDLNEILWAQIAPYSNKPTGW